MDLLEQFPLVKMLVEFLEPFDSKWFVSGGWAIDLHINQVTRERCDLDISIPRFDRLGCIEFFLSREWQVEGKRNNGFQILRKVSDYDNDILYFWSFPRGVDFISIYIDKMGNRRISYNRDTQNKLDYIEVFFDRIEDGYYIFRKDARIKRRKELAILNNSGVRYLAPELVLLYKADDLSSKNHQDFNVVTGSLGVESSSWLKEALSLVYGVSHPWWIIL
jgi:hypothetical protein